MSDDEDWDTAEHDVSEGDKFNTYNPLDSKGQLGSTTVVKGARAASVKQVDLKVSTLRVHDDNNEDEDPTPAKQSRGFAAQSAATRKSPTGGGSSFSSFARKSVALLRGKSPKAASSPTSPTWGAGAGSGSSSSSAVPKTAVGPKPELPKHVPSPKSKLLEVSAPRTFSTKIKQPVKSSEAFTAKLSAAQMDFFNKVCRSSFSAQAVHFLNAYWHEIGSQAEFIFSVAWETMKHADMHSKGIQYIHLYEEGCDLELNIGLYFYEKLCKRVLDDPEGKKWRNDPQYEPSMPTMLTALVRKQELREKVDVNFDGRISFLEYLCVSRPTPSPISLTACHCVVRALTLALTPQLPNQPTKQPIRLPAPKQQLVPIPCLCQPSRVYGARHED